MSSPPSCVSVHVFWDHCLQISFSIASQQDLFSFASMIGVEVSREGYRHSVPAPAISSATAVSPQQTLPENLLFPEIGTIEVDSLLFCHPSACYVYSNYSVVPGVNASSPHYVCRYKPAC